MTDDELAALAQRRKTIGAQMAALVDEKNNLDARILAEIERRKTRVLTSKRQLIPGVEVRGLKIMRLTQATTTYDLEQAAKVLKPGVLRRIVRKHIPADAVQEAQAAGVLTDDQVKEFEVRTETAVYPRVYGTLTD